MIIHESIKIFNENIVSFSSAPIDNKSTFFSFHNNFWYINWMFFLIFIIKSTNVDWILFFDFLNVSNFYWKFYAFKIKLFYNIFFSSFFILLELWFTGFKYLTKIHLKHSLLSIFWILIKHFLGWSNSLGNFI